MVFPADVGLWIDPQEIQPPSCQHDSPGWFMRGGGLVGGRRCSPGDIFRDPIWFQYYFEGGGTRDTWGTVVERLIGRLSACKGTVVRSIGFVCTRLREGGGQHDSRRARAVLNPCARESWAPTWRFLREKPISDHDLSSSSENQQRVTNSKSSSAVLRGYA